MDRESPPKRLPLLVDYSTQKANLSNLKAKSILCPDTFYSKRSRSLAETIDDALAETESTSRPDKPLSLEESFTMGSGNAVEFVNVSFRVRRSGLDRCVSFDERKLSSVEHLQNSLSALILAEKDNDHQEDNSSSRSSLGPPPDRRLYLARSCSLSGKSMISNKSHSVHTTTTTARPCPAHILRKAKSSRNVLSSPSHSFMSTNTTGIGHTHDPANCCPDQQGVQHGRCAKCRKSVRRVKSLDEASNWKLLEENLSLASQSLHSPTAGSTSHHGVSRRTHLIKTLSSKTLSRRNLMVASTVNNHHSHSTNRNNKNGILLDSSSSHHHQFTPPKKSCIRKLDKHNSSRNLLAANSLRQSLFMMSMSHFEYQNDASGNHHDEAPVFPVGSRLRSLNDVQ
jgi:hypothetical protein